MSRRRANAKRLSSDGAAWPSSTWDTKARVSGKPSALWLSPRSRRSDRMRAPRATLASKLSPYGVARALFALRCLEILDICRPVA